MKFLLGIRDGLPGSDGCHLTNRSCLELDEGLTIDLDFIDLGVIEKMSSVVVDQIEENWSMVDQAFIDEISQI